MRPLVIEPMKNIAVIPGDGIGPEVVREAVRVLKHFNETRGVRTRVCRLRLGRGKVSARWRHVASRRARNVDCETSTRSLQELSAIRRVPSNKHAEDILLGMRRGLDLYINLRPVRLLNDRLTPLAQSQNQRYRFRGLS